jgi:hypothetical protein
VPFVKPFRHPWQDGFPDVWIFASESTVKQHPAYKAAKAGDVDAALDLVLATLNDDAIVSLLEFGELSAPILVSVHAEEAVGVNAIPEVMADILAKILGWELEQFVVQANVVNHTGANGFARMARQAIFEGEITPGRNYLIVDDFIGQGGTIANLRGHIMEQGGSVIGATVLTGKAYSAILALDSGTLNALRDQHGQIEEWWKERFGFGYDCLTASEARYLIKTPESERIRARIEESDIAE